MYSFAIYFGNTLIQQSKIASISKYVFMEVLYSQYTRNRALTQNVLGELYFYGECIYSMLWLCADNVMFGASVKDVMFRNIISVVMLLTIMLLLNTIKILSNLK